MEPQARTIPELWKYLREICAAKTSGELILRNGPEGGKIFLDSGHITWAFATNQQESFQGILAKEYSFTKQALLDGIRASRTAGQKNLDDILQTLKVDDAETRRSIIERHTHAALEAISSWGECLSQFVPRSAPSAKSESQESAQTIVSTMSAVDGAMTVLRELQREVSGLRAAVIIDGETGMPVASFSQDSTFDPERVSAYYHNLNQSARLAEEIHNHGTTNSSGIEEVLISGEKYWSLIKPIPESDNLLYLSLDKSTNPVVARVALKRHQSELSRVLKQ